MIVDAKGILKGVNQKDMKAWEKLYAYYYAALCSYANNIVNNQDNAQDIVQDTLIKIWNSDRKFEDLKDLTWYLYKAVYNNSLFWLRSNNTREQVSHELPEVENIQDEVFVETVREELIRQLYLYIEELPGEQKKIMLLSIQGKSGNEIAEILGVSINTVKTQKNRSFKYLREKLKDSSFLLLL